MTADSLPVMIAGAGLAGLGTALFHPAALAGLPRLMGDADDRRARRAWGSSARSTTSA